MANAALVEGECIGPILEWGLMSIPSARPKPLYHVVIPCAGTGSRAGGAGPKQYQMLVNEPMVVHTLRAFAGVPALARMVLVTSPVDEQMPALLSGLGDARFEVAAKGGATRADSVLAGLQHLKGSGGQDDDWVLVHDAARCLITPALIEHLMQACADDPVGGLLAVPLPDTLKQASQGRSVATVRRDDKWLAQTPQMFRLGRLLEALLSAQQHGFAQITDEASALERLGLSVQLVEGHAQNFKLTYPHDFALAEAVLRATQRAC